MQVVEWSLRRSDCVPAMLNRPEWVPECADQTIPLDGSLKREFPCHPPCSSLEWRSTMSDLRTSKGFKISVEFSRRKEVLVEVRKMGITDVLSFIGGGTSLFLGCSCVTLMETFIFLLKLVLQSVNKESYDGIGTESEQSRVETSMLPEQRLLSDLNLTHASPTRFGVDEEDVIASTGMQSPPRKSIHCVRFLKSTESDDENVQRRHYRPRPPSLSELRSSSAFNDMDTHNIERSLKNLPLSQRLTFDGNMERRHLKRQNAVDITDDKLDQYLSEPTTTRSFCDDFDRKHPARVKIRRISSVTSRGSGSSSRANVHIVEHPRRRSQIYNKFMVMNDF